MGRGPYQDLLVGATDDKAAVAAILKKSIVALKRILVA
jgi:hypothetical protein